MIPREDQPAVVPPDEDGEVAVALLAHGHPLVRDPDGRALAQGAHGDLQSGEEETVTGWKTFLVAVNFLRGRRNLN